MIRRIFNKRYSANPSTDTGLLVSEIHCEDSQPYPFRRVVLEFPISTLHPDVEQIRIRDRCSAIFTARVQTGKRIHVSAHQYTPMHLRNSKSL